MMKQQKKKMLANLIILFVNWLNKNKFI